MGRLMSGCRVLYRDDNIGSTRAPIWEILLGLPEMLTLVCVGRNIPLGGPWDLVTTYSSA